MNARIRTLIVAALMVVALGTSAVWAQENPSPAESQGSCPPGFELHEAHLHDHEGENPHRHVGTDADLNGDGWICVKHASKDSKVHVHIDNNLP